MADFLDKVLVGINKGVNTVSENSKLIVEKARLNTQLKEVEEKKLKLARQLGILAYNMQTKEEIEVEQFQGICDEITMYNGEVEKLKIEINSLEGSKTVHIIDSTVNSADGIRCSCGTVNKQGSKFCATCGNKLE